MSDAVWVALIVSLLAPTLMVWLQNRNAAAKEKRDYARQDAVAARAAEVAKQLIDQQEEQARLLKENNRVAAENAAETNREIKVLTGMLDGGFTKLMEDNLAALSNGLVLSRQVMAFTFTQTGREPDKEELAELERVKVRIKELTTAITERRHADAMASHSSGSAPLPVADNRTAVAAERSATALERAADAAEDKNA